MTSLRALVALALAVVFASSGGCSLEVPSDPDGTTDRVSGEVLRVGGSLAEGLVDEDDGEVSGSEAELVEGFAETLDAQVEWRIGGEEALVGALEHGDLDLVVGGLTDQTPWVDKVGLTRGYTGIEGAEGRSLVWLVPMGENAFLSRIEHFLDAEVG